MFSLVQAVESRVVPGNEAKWVICSCHAQDNILHKLCSELNTQFGMNSTLCILQFLMSIHVFCYYTSVRVLCYYVPYISRHVHIWIFNIAVGVLSAAKVCKRFC